MTIVLDVAKVLLMLLEHHATTALQGFTVRAPDAAPRSSHHSVGSVHEARAVERATAALRPALAEALRLRRLRSGAAQ